MTFNIMSVSALQPTEWNRVLMKPKNSKSVQYELCFLVDCLVPPEISRFSALNLIIHTNTIYISVYINSRQKVKEHLQKLELFQNGYTDLAKILTKVRFDIQLHAHKISRHFHFGFKVYYHFCDNGCVFEIRKSRTCSFQFMKTVNSGCIRLLTSCNRHTDVSLTWRIVGGMPGG